MTDENRSVAEGPAATPPQEIGDYSCVCGFAMKEPCEHWKAFLANQAAAAAPPEARAAARKWLDENFQPHSQSGDYLRRDATDSTEYATWDLMAEYAADLQRQLDEARREREAQDKVWQIRLKGWRDDLQCAEAANQEARRGAQKALLPIAALVQSGACVNAPTELTENIKLAILDAHDTLCALLGPQHGDTK